MKTAFLILALGFPCLVYAQPFVGLYGGLATAKLTNTNALKPTIGYAARLEGGFSFANRFMAGLQIHAQSWQFSSTATYTDNLGNNPTKVDGEVSHGEPAVTVLAFGRISPRGKRGLRLGVGAGATIAHTSDRIEYEEIEIGSQRSRVPVYYQTEGATGPAFMGQLGYSFPLPAGLSLGADASVVYSSMKMKAGAKYNVIAPSLTVGIGYKL